MKKLTTLIMFLAAAAGALAQTTKQVTSSLDTIYFTPAQYVPEKYTPAQFIPASFTPSSFTAAKMEIHPYAAPVSTPVVSTPTGSGTTTSTGNAIGGIVSAPVILKSNTTVSGLTIDLKNTANYGIEGTNVSNVKIVNCKILNSTNDGIHLSGCTNIEIVNCFITNVKAGVNAMRCKTVNVHNNQFLNMNGPFPSGNFVQFNNVNGSGNHIDNNICEDIAGVAQHPQDGLSVYQSNGLLGDSITVVGNWIRGGQVQNDSGGGAGIVLGDVGGSYQVARNNIIVNGGFVGAQVQGGHDIKMDHNVIYSSSTPYSNCGLCYGNYSGASSYNITMSYNQVKFFNKNNVETDAWVDPKAGYTPAGWSTNILKANITAAILPTTIITYK